MMTDNSESLRYCNTEPRRVRPMPPSKYVCDKNYDFVVVQWVTSSPRLGNHFDPYIDSVDRATVMFFQAMSRGYTQKSSYCHRAYRFITHGVGDDLAYKPIESGIYIPRHMSCKRIDPGPHTRVYEIDDYLLSLENSAEYYETMPAKTPQMDTTNKDRSRAIRAWIFVMNQCRHMYLQSSRERKEFGHKSIAAYYTQSSCS